MTQNVHLTLSNGVSYTGIAKGKVQTTTGELVFTTGMVGYTQSLTDPSFAGQILVFTYPLIGNYGVESDAMFESEKIQVAGVVVSSLINDQNIWRKKSIVDWLDSQNIPVVEVKDTRKIVQMLRMHGTLQATIANKISKPNESSSALWPAVVSTQNIKVWGNGKKKVLLIDCGVKKNIINELLQRKATVIQAPYDFDPLNGAHDFHGVLVSNGPGDPKALTKTISHLRNLLEKDVPLFGICLGNQLISLAGGGNTQKMKYGHRGQNQPCRLEGTERLFLTTQNHGYVVSEIPRGFVPWFTNANDSTNEGIRHLKKSISSVQFHPEACPGPTDTTWLFDDFIENM